MTAGTLREKVAFDLRSTVSDGAGNFEESWVQVGVAVAARIKPLKGGEQVIAQRLTGIQPVVISVRSTTATRAITTAHRLRNTRGDKTYNINAVTPDERRAYIDFLCTAGGADG